MAQCITCGTELHPERAEKYNYCMARECQEKNARALNVVTIGINKAADEILILDDDTRENLASGRYHDQRRGLFGTSAPSAPRAAAGTATSGRPARRARPQPKPQRSAAARRWTKSQEKLALLYNEQGLRPAEIAEKLGLSSYLVTQIILSAKNRGKI
jgi:hypothetical protein